MPVGIFSIEMCGRSLMNRMIAARTGLNSIALRKGELTDKQRKTRDNALADIVKLPLYVDDSSAATVQYIRRASIDWIKAGIRILALDYIQLMTAGKASSTDLRASFIGDCIRTLKQLARDHDVLFLVLSQLNRESAKANRAPTVADLKDSGELEQVADNILLIHKNGEGQDIVYDLLLEKWRNGPSGIVSTQFNAARTRFESVKEEKKGIL
jgi:replicative DNA helicase